MMAVERMREGENMGTVHVRWRRAKGRSGTASSRRHRAEAGVSLEQWQNPMQYGFDFGLGKRDVVRELILKKFEVSLSVTSVGTLLARFGLTPQKPLQRVYQRDPQAVVRWQHETYPDIALQAGQTGVDIRFWDEPGFRADVMQGKTGVSRVRRQTPVVLAPRSAAEHQRSFCGQCQRRFLPHHLSRRAHG